MKGAGLLYTVGGTVNWCHHHGKQHSPCWEKLSGLTPSFVSHTVSLNLSELKPGVEVWIRSGPPPPQGSPTEDLVVPLRGDYIMKVLTSSMDSSIGMACQ